MKDFLHYLKALARQNIRQLSRGERMEIAQQYKIEWALINNAHHTANTLLSILHFSVNKSATQYVKDLLMA